MADDHGTQGMKPALSEAEKAVRRDHVEQTVHQLRLEGITQDAETRALFEQWAEGEISFDELEAAVAGSDKGASEAA